MIRSQHDHFPAVYKRREHNSCSLSPTVSVLPSVIPAQAGIHCGGTSALPTTSDLLDHV
jgi:hypothetical protein